MSELKQKYEKEVIKGMQDKFQYGNKMAVPKIIKVIINTGFGKIVSPKTKDEQKRFNEYVVENISLIAGQRPVLTTARKSISSFKLREGNIIGAKVTLRGKKMYDFLEKLINNVMPRVRDFRGISTKIIDKNGNMNLGIKEHIVFPEISPEKSPVILGLQITIVTNAKSKEEGIELFKLLDFPMKKS
ncbi:MAG: 50S ribosomal protein L5 [Candidatus Pacebacteria bacterium]|nr:50S ribosomal protein L5 [Candidatus Paceibacterota bacterium]MDD5013273.1 50S ribosomal protein L5 [Candidatus Paceibacterota bacterium]MDD5752892.1 50S ribosomal protein L5 [Candidatus Paceibacterota bacterium]